MAEPARRDSSSDPTPVERGKPGAPRKVRGAHGRKGLTPATAPSTRAAARGTGTKARTGLSGQARLRRLIVEQGVKPIKDIESLRGDFWPEEEDPDLFDATIRAWREGRPAPPPP